MKYHIITYGCQMNKSDSERISAFLEKKGYNPASKENEADLIVVNMCSVRQSAVDRVYGLFPKFKKLKTRQNFSSKNLGGQAKLKTILTGCVLKEDKKKFSKIFDLILDIKDLPNWLKKFQSYRAKKVNFLLPPSLKLGRPICRTIKKEVNYLRIQPKYQNKSVAFVTISNGCNYFCAYCVVPFVRGSLVCRSHEEILKEVKRAIKKGFKEIWLLGQNVNDYQSPSLLRSKSEGKDERSSSTPADSSGEEEFSSSSPSSLAPAGDSVINFAKLLKKIDDLSGDFKILFTSPHPQNFSDELINTLADCKKFGEYINLPAQSGDNEILKKMNRNYTIKRYKNLVKKIREKIPQIKLSTDVIVGFPGETKKQFQNTAKLFKKIKFDWAYIAKYSPRSGTSAFKLKDNVPLVEKKRREKVLREILKNRVKS